MQGLLRGKLIQHKSRTGVMQAVVGAGVQYTGRDTAVAAARRHPVVYCRPSETGRAVRNGSVLECFALSVSPEMGEIADLRITQNLDPPVGKQIRTSAQDQAGPMEIAFGHQATGRVYRVYVFDATPTA